MLATALGLAVAATAAVALAVPTVTSSVDAFASGQQTSQVARGKATGPGTAVVDPTGASGSAL